MPVPRTPSCPRILRGGSARLALRSACARVWPVRSGLIVVGCVLFCVQATGAQAATPTIVVSSVSKSVKAGSRAHIKLALAPTVGSCRLLLRRAGVTRRRSASVPVTRAELTWKWTVPRRARSARWELQAACVRTDAVKRVVRRTLTVRGTRSGRFVVAGKSIPVRNFGAELRPAYAAAPAPASLGPLLYSQWDGVHAVGLDGTADRLFVVVGGGTTTLESLTGMPVLSADGSKLAYKRVTSRVGNTWLFERAASGRGGEVNLGEFVPRAGGNLQYLPNGHLIHTSGQAGAGPGSDLAVYDCVAVTCSRAGTVPAQGSDGIYELRVSPNGTRWLWSDRRMGPNTSRWRIWVADAGGANPVELTRAQTAYTGATLTRTCGSHPRWLSDTKIIFAGCDFSSAREEQVTTMVPAQGAVTQTAIVGQVDRFGTIDSDNSNLSWLTSGAARDNPIFEMSVSPNGAWLAYTDSTWDLRVLRTDDSGSRLVTHLGLGGGGGANGDGIGWRANP